MTIWIDGDVNVPTITDDDLADRVSRFRALVVHGGERKLHHIKTPLLRNQAFTWSPTVLGEAAVVREVCRVKTDHLCGYYGFFKPSIAEVLAQLPQEAVAGGANAFYIILDAEGNDDEIKVYRTGNGHRATTVYVTVTTPATDAERGG